MSFSPYPPGPFTSDWLLATAKRAAKGELSPHVTITHALDNAVRDQDDVLRARLGFTGGPPALTIYETPYGRVLLSESGKKNPNDLTRVQWYDRYAKLARTMLDTFKPKKLAIVIENEAPLELVAEAITCAMMSAHIFKTGNSEDTYYGPDALYLVHTGVIEEGVEFASRLAVGLERGDFENLARFLSSCPLNVIDVDKAAELVYAMVSTNEHVKIHEPTPEEYARMGLLNGTCLGSGRPGRVIAIQIDPSSGTTTEVDIDVAKGLVFDDGGANYKNEHVDQMEKDKSAAMRKLAKALYFILHPERLKRTFVATLVLAENRIDGDACMHGDIWTAYDGRTMQDQNTDAEGRKVLADAIAWLVEKYANRINRLLTTATLTGHCVLAFGKNVSGLMVRGNDRAVFDKLEDIGLACADRVHRLVVDPEDDKTMDAELADIRNVDGVRDRGAMKGAAFLWKFVPPSVKLVVHLDIARVADEKGKNMADGIAPPGGFCWDIETHPQ